ncbi:SDR family NAD(P)-dependent oxidoreductase [Limosilactobacillus sp.]|jgi:3alpha(or 20beta)-hydroxysteroid dehydrogenase|uniref:SDR family NAD(P)-dependent oxidoreductase n=1 Tax=Limosilactobacillus sp. TaxID=2773925 RepID=UPI0025BD24EC|nr:glucose 1-dehydrogenase [Limosilactobacillus sp.]MCI2031680.1 glucose 1-dehydrogenase [Limosilactobacillus sp.]
MGKLDNKVAIITGASQGMGASHAKLFLKEGAKVVITDINAEKGQAFAKELDPTGDKVIFVKQDVSNEDDWQNVVKETIDHFGKIDVLVNNAGISITKSIFDCSLADYLKIVNINQVSVFLGMKYVGAEMKKQRSGSIVNISSIDGIVGGAIGYTDTKFAVRGMTKAVALELAPYNVRVNSVHPGVVETPMIKQHDNSDEVKAFAKTIPLQRIAKPIDVSKMVAFLASDEADYSTGSEFIVDGGLTAK